MAQGYASDVIGDDTVMDSPDCTISVDPSRLNREQAIALGQLGDVADETALNICQNDPEFPHSDMGDIEFHVPFESAVSMLMAVGVIEDTEIGEDD